MRKLKQKSKNCATKTEWLVNLGYGPIEFSVLIIHCLNWIFSANFACRLGGGSGQPIVCFILRYTLLANCHIEYLTITV